MRLMLTKPESEWATLMFDASGRLLRSGFISGTITDYGDYDQCMDIDIPDDSYNIDQNMQARYCLMTIRLPLPLPNERIDFNGTKYSNHWVTKWWNEPRYRFYYRIVNGLCFPSDCQQKEIKNIAKKLFENFEFNIEIEACQTREEQKYAGLDSAQRFSLFILAICIFTVIVGTIIDRKYCCSQSNFNPWIEFWIGFSLIKNTEKLFTINDENGGKINDNNSKTVNKKSNDNYDDDNNNNVTTTNDQITVVHGLRFLLIMWVITCHTTNFAPLGLYDQPMIAARFAERIQIVRDFWTQFVISGSLSVSGFFIISGFISLHTALKNPKIFLKSIPYWKYILLRWLRFSPPLLGMFCYQFLWPKLGNGPMMHWDYLRFGHQPCYERWWANFLYISNWFKLTDQCASHTWYLSADFQINLLAYFFIWLYLRNYNVGFISNIFALSLAVICPICIHWYYGVPLVHVMEPDIDKLNIAFSMIDFYTFNHYSAYFTGMLIAGLLHNSNFTLKKSTRQTLWIVSVVLTLIIPFSTYPFIQMDSIPSSSIITIMYTGIKRFFWIFSLGWIVYGSCTDKNKNIISRFLSAKIFQPFSRLTFSIYLTQSLVVWYYAYQSRELHTISHYNSIFRIGGHTLYSLMFGYILYILFEAPSVNFCKFIFKRSMNELPTISESADDNDSIKELINRNIDSNNDNLRKQKTKSNQCKLD